MLDRIKSFLDIRISFNLFEFILMIVVFVGIVIALGGD